MRGEEARQARIVLRTPRRKAVFIAGLIGAVILAIVLVVIAA
ncbi:MAG: peptide ABC transporter permease [Rhodospirillaceae bacterium]|nr:peptide ABC transporter permease [Rhodospirillaceae bacterium]